LPAWGYRLGNLKRIAFFWIGMDVSIPTVLVASIRRAFGNDIEIVQISDHHTRLLTA
jgi:hypothetical protein